jgi:hypothetical protein
MNDAVDDGTAVNGDLEAGRAAALHRGAGASGVIGAALRPGHPGRLSVL